MQNLSLSGQGRKLAGVILLFGAFLVFSNTTTSVIAISLPGDPSTPILLKKKTPLDKPLEYPFNVNTADAKTLMRVPGINRTAARQIVNHRDRNGDYTSIDQLAGFSGISEARIFQLKKYLSVQ